MVLPLTDTDICPVPDKVDTGGPKIEIVAFDPELDWLKDITPEPTRTTLPVLTVPVVPKVFPIVETPKLIPPPPPPPPAPEITTEPLDIPTETLPAPWNRILPIAWVPEDP